MAATRSVTIETAPVLRLSAASAAAPALSLAALQDGLGRTDAVARLVALCRFARLPPSLQRAPLLELLMRQLESETDGDCVVKIVGLIASVGLEAAVWGDAAVSRLHGELRRALPVDHLCAVLGALVALTAQHQLPLPDGTDRIAARLLQHESHRVRALTLLLLAECSDRTSRFAAEAAIAIGKFAVDPDSRVRRTALEAMLTQARRGAGVLTVEMYGAVVAALNDDFEEVRLPATRLLRPFAEAFPSLVLPARGMRLVDDAFVKVCDRVNDSAVAVRTEACRELGSFRGMSPALLEQTLSKQIMSHLAKRQSYQEEQRAKLGFDVQSRGRPWQGQALPASDRDVADDNISLLESGACGAFVHGLEDEFERVRTASLRSLCRLSLQSEEFAAKALDFIVDMLSDEIDDVRMHAIRALMLVSRRHQTRIRQDQLTIMMMLFHDSTAAIRLAVHDLVGAVRVADLQCLSMAVTELLANLARYPDDHDSIMTALAQLGRNHAAHCAFLVRQLLKIDRAFLTPEPKLDETPYRAVLVFVLNAAAHNPSICTLLPKHVFEHYLFLRRWQPRLFEPGALQFWREAPSTSMMDKSLERDVERDVGGPALADEGGEMLRMIVARLAGLPQLGALLDEARVRTRQTHDDLDYLRQISQRFEGPSAWLETFLECLQVLVAVKRQLRPDELPASGDVRFIAQAAQLHASASRLLQGFHSVGSAELAPELAEPVRELQVAAHVLHMVGLLTSGDDSSKQTRDDLAALVERLDAVPAVWNLANQIKLLLNAPTLAFETLIDLLLGYLRDVWPRSMPSSDALEAVRRKAASLDAPVPHPEKPISFVASMVLELPLRVTVRNVVDLAAVAVQVRLPSQAVQTFWPRPGNLRRMMEAAPDATDDDVEGILAGSIRHEPQAAGDTVHELTLPIHLLNATWTDASDIAVDVVQVLSIAHSPLDRPLRTGRHASDDTATLSLLPRPVVFTVAPRATPG